MHSSASRDVSLEANKITVHFPIHMMNMLDGPEDGTEQVAIGIKIGSTELWSALHEIDILGLGAGAVGAAQPTIVSIVK